MKMVMQIFCIVYIAMCGLLILDDILPELISKEERWYVGVRGVVALMQRCPRLEVIKMHRKCVNASWLDPTGDGNRARQLPIV